MDINTPTVDNSNKHLAVETITSYINYFDQLSLYETEQVNCHLPKCQECQDKYNEIFDKLLEEAHNKHSISLFNNDISKVEPNQVLFEDISNNFRLIIKKNLNDDFILIFNLIPHSVHNNMIRIFINELGQTLRFLNVDVNKEYKIEFPSGTSLNALSEIGADILVTTSRTTFPKTKERRFNLVTTVALVFICGILLMALFYFFNNKKENHEVILMTHTRKEMLDTDNNGRQKGENKPLQQQNNSLETSKYDSTSSIDSIFNIMPEDVKLRNEFSRNFILERDVDMVDTTGNGIVIISPSIGDTLHNSIKFRWMDMGKNNAYEINIVDNKNQIMYETTIRGNDLIYSGKLKPGLYYWKIFVNDQLKQSGKFVIE